MIVIGPAQDILDESYLVSIESRGYIQEPGESPIKPPQPPPPPTPSQLSCPSTPLRKSPLPPSLPCNTAGVALGLPDLIPAGHRDRVDRFTPAVNPTDPHEGRETIIIEMHPQGVTIRDLVHPSLTEPLKNHQQTSFKLVKLVSDFNHKLSMIHEQFAEDTAQLVEAFRKRTSDILHEGPRCNSSLAMSWDQWMSDVLQDSLGHTEIASVLGRTVARTLLEKTFHMKIQSRKVFTQRENYEGLLANTEDNLTKVHNDYRQCWSRHVEQPTQESLAIYLEKHNSYVQQIHCTNSCIDHYYVDCLPHLLQELDDVYQDVSAVVVDSLTEGAKTISQKTTSMTARWNKVAEGVQKINPEQDLNEFIQSLHVPDFVPITRHSFLPVPSKDVNNDLGLPIKTCEVVLDRAVSENTRIRYDNLRAEAKAVEGSVKLGNDALEALIRIQAKNLDQQLFNKANEIQEEISRKRIELRLSQIQLAGVRAQKELFSSKVCNEAESKGQVDGVPASGPRERKLSNSSTGNIKNKWVKAFKTIKGKDSDKSKGAGNGTVQIMENSHIFQEYTYKKITPCDVCSQILRGHSRQGLKCKMCRMNVHPDCQDKVIKCQPKSKLLRRQKSASEFDSRTEDIESGGNTRRGSTDQSGVRRDIASPHPMMVDEGKITPTSPQLMGGIGGLSGGMAVGSGLSGIVTDEMAAAQQRSRRKMGGSYSTYTGPSPNNGYGVSSGLAVGFFLNNDDDLVDSSGRRIKTEGYTSSMLGGGNMEVGAPIPFNEQPRHA
jgi:hypothetical protein